MVNDTHTEWVQHPDLLDQLGIAPGSTMADDRDRLGSNATQVNAHNLTWPLSSGYRLILRYGPAGLDWAFITLAESRDFWADDWTYEEMVGLRAEILAQFNACLAAYTEQHGPPQWHGRSDAPGFPDSLLVEEAAVWPRTEWLFLLEFVHEDKELPIELRLSWRAHTTLTDVIPNLLNGE